MTELTDSGAPEPIAIVGMACRFPGAADPAAFWRNLAVGVESIRFFSEAELRAAGVGPEVSRQPGYVPAHGWLDGVDRFDADFFGISPREAETLDPQHRLFLECAWEAIEHAGHNPDTVGERFGVVASAGLNTYLLANILPRKDVATAANFYALFIGNDKDFLPTRVSYKLNLRGPSLSVNTACSSSLVAVHVACQMLWSYQCDGALAGGVSLQVPQVRGYQYQPGAIASADGHCRAFDAAAGGTVTGSGVGAVVLKRLSDAVAAGDTVHAVIRGTAINNDGALKAGYTAPGVEGQAAVIAEAMALAGVTPESISYVEAHGTGTSLGDPIEVSALTQAFGAGPRPGSCRIGAVKTNIGHLDTAAGVAGLIKTTLALQNETIPATVHFTAPNPKIDFASTPFVVNAGRTGWPRSATPRRAGVSSFGIGGTNAHAILEEAPASPQPPLRKSPRLFVLSARSRAALDRATQRLSSHLASSGDRPDDVAWTLGVGRKAFAHGAFAVADSTGDLATALTSGRITTGERPASSPKIAFVFPGQGAQQVGAGRELYRDEAVFRSAFDACAEALIAAGAPDVRPLLFRESTPEAEDVLRQTVHAQAVLFATGCALDALWRSWGIVPGAVIGHSSGEYAAAVSAGLLSLADAAKVVASRARLMNRMPPGVMAAVGIGEGELQALLPAGLLIAAVNTPALCTVAGEAAALTALEEQLTGRGVMIRRLQTAHAFHSPAVDSVLPEFRSALEGVTFHAPQVAFYSAVLGTRADLTKLGDPELWVKQVRQPVLFATAVESLLADGFTTLVELGPGSTLTGLARLARSKPVATIAGLSREGDHRAQLGALGQLWLQGAHVRWEAVLAADQPRRIPLPTYAFEPTRHWLALSERSESNGLEPIAESAGAKGVSDWFYVPAWEQSPPLVDTTPAPLSGRWLVFARASGADQPLLDELRSRGATVTAVTPDGAADFVALLARLERDGQFPDRVLHCWTLGGADEAAVQELGFNAMCRFVRALAHHGGAVREITLLTSGVAEVHGREALNPHTACLLGLVGAIPPEFPGTACRIVDIDADVKMPDVARELARASADPVTAWRGRTRWIGRFEPLQLPPINSEAPVFRPGGSYLITGGVGGLGLVLAEHLAQTAHAHLVLTTRRALAPADQWERLAREAVRQSGIDTPLPALIEQISAMEQRTAQDLGIQVMRERSGLLQTANALSAAYALEYLQSRGVLAQPGNQYSRAAIHAACQVLPQFRRLVDHLLTTLAQQAFVRVEGDKITVLQASAPKPAAEQLTAACAAHPGLAPTFELLDYCASNYADALSGRVPAVSVLFPDGGRGRIVDANMRTDEYANNRVYRTLLADLLASLASRPVRRSLGEGGRPFRILEVGGGNAIMTGLIAERLAALQVDVEYVFTDIGRSFVVAAEARARERGYGFMRFATFDISRDPAAQGFEPGSFDAVIGLDVVHATPLIADTIRHLRVLLAGGGLLGLVESARTHRWNDMVWGLAEGWWLFQDPELRNDNSPLLSTAKWEAALASFGFSSIAAFPQGEAERADTDCSLILAQRPQSEVVGDPAIYRALQRIRAQAASVEVCQADVADEAEMERVVAAAESRHGRIHGVIHAAAVEDKALIVSRDRAVEDHEFRPKVAGTLVLDQVFRSRPLDFMVLCSSMTAITGGPGQVGYCGANAFLDAFAAARSREHDGRTVSINWGRWQGVGLARDYESWHQTRTGEALIGGMTIEDGLEALHRILHYRPGPRVAVMTSEWRPDQRPATPALGEAVRAGAAPVSVAMPADAFDGTPLEQQLAAIWRQVLGSGRFDRHTTFQELGGDSLVGIQMLARIREQLGVQLPIHTVFDAPTIAALSIAIEQASVEMEEGTL
ncbi:MAG: SDR family NAD(P)-dependent oxidoreductase [Acidobacteriota bacterium]|nr:SDR family NAD(P)-dependent oxidoreductase [Acidobacteriota bacterium]